MKRNVTFWDRLAGVNPFVWDGFLAGALLLIQFLAVGSAQDGPGRRSDVIPALVLLTTTVPLAWRRAAPVVVLVVVAFGTAVAGAIEGFPIVTVSASIASYSATAHRERSRALFAAMILASAGAIAQQLNPNVATGPIEQVIGVAFIVWIPAALGALVRDRRRWRARDKERTARDAVNSERARIARELHDVVAHSMGVMVVQAGGARTILDKDPDEVERVLHRIEDTGRTGLSELRRLLEADRSHDGNPELAPADGMERLDRLVDEMRLAGLSIDVEVLGRQSALPPGVDLSAYRIVQEALTNALKHAGPTSVHVRLIYKDDALHIEVIDEGGLDQSDPLGDAGSGRGLIGMRERVALLDGDLEARPRSGGGFSVKARLPLRGER